MTVSYSYTSGTFSGRKWKTVYPDDTLSITGYAKSGSNLTTTVDQGAGSGSTVTSGTRTITVTNAAGNATSSTVSDIASGLTLSSASYTLDAYGRVTRTDYQGGTYSTTEYGCCGPTQQVAQDGSVTTMAYNPLKQLDHEASAGITTFYSYDAQGNITSTTVKGTDNSELTTTNTYNAAGRLVSTTAPGNQTTTYAESWADGVRYNTTTYPGGLTSIEKYNLDGTLAEVSGTAVHPVKYEYGVANGELYTRVIKVGDNNALDLWEKSFVNMAGNTYKTVYADNTSSQAFFDSVNRQIKQVSPSGVVALTAYNNDGDVSASAIDMNRNDTIDYSGPDRVTGYSKAVANKNGVTVRRNVTSVYQDSSGTPTDASVSEVSADGLNSWQTSFGQATVSQTALNGNGQRTITVTNPDGSTVSSVYLNGLMSSSTHSVLGTTTYIYDAFNRPLTVTRAENGVQKTVTYAYNDAGQTVSITEAPGNRVTSYAYDNMGRRTSVTYPGSRTVNYTYADTGEYLTVTGADTYPQAFTYDTQGRMKTLTTYKTYPGTPEVTTWNYDSARGFMVSKVYPDNKQVTYTNDADGRPLTRVWARGITTTYAYDNGGSLTGVSYSDGTTPAISYSLDRMDRITAVTDASGSRTLSYNADGTLASESIPYIVTGAVEYTYDSLGRRTGLQLKQNSLPVFGNNYTYDAMSRLATVSDGTNTAAYSRIAGTNLLNTTTVTAGGVTKLTATRSYDAQNRLTSISSTAGSVTKTYSYTYDDKDRRSRLDMADGSYWTYTYDAKGQIVSGAKYDSTNKAIPGQAFTYAYDDIGNLTSEQRGMAAMQFDYTSNLVNQYTQRTIPGFIPVTGQASATSTVSVWLKNHGANAAAVVKPTRDGEYFSTTIPVNNSTANVTEALEITAVKFDTAQDKDVVKTINGTYTVPKTPQLFTYDDDGNTLSNGVWTYTYNAENRPITAVNAASTAKLEYAYDYDGRRVSKKIYAKSGVAWTLTKEIKFVYDGNNLIAKYDANNVFRHGYLWGEDISGTLQETGGIGGLLSVTDGTSSYYPAYDGNGNVRAYVDSSGALVAEYDYSPSGKPATSGAKAADFPFQFSTQYYDKETGTLHNKYRDYDLDLMRWLTQDPMGEDGGVNLYCMVNNNPVCSVDGLGLKQVLFTLLLGPAVGDYENSWKQIETDYKSNGGKEDICFKTLKDVSAANVVQSAENGYGFLMAHGKLYYDGEDITAERYKGKIFASLDDAVGYANERAKSKAKSKGVAKIEHDNKFITNATNLKPNVPKVTDKDIIVKMQLRDPLPLTAKEVLAAGLPGIKTLYSDRVNFYGCYAGHLIPATNGGLTIGAGHNLNASLSQATSLGFILKDAKQMLQNNK